MIALITKLVSFMTALVCTIVPFVGYSAERPDDIQLNVAMISDTHIDERLPLGQLMLASGLEDMSRNQTPNDAVLIAGDMTNYGNIEAVEVFYNVMKKHSPYAQWVIAPGNHDIGHVEDFTHDEARQWLIDLYNGYTGEETDKIYYSKDIKGYTFIVLCDESEDNWDSCDIYDEQIAFLDSELQRATAEGKPAFVVCHWPVEGTNGQPIIYEDSGLDGEYSQKVQATLEKYENVFFISGHMHAGINGRLVKEAFGFSCVETINGVTYVNLPTYDLVNRYGIPWNGMGMQMEVYENEVVFRARRYLVSRWYAFHEYEVPLV